jgi:preprotein translocase subunit SecE
MADKIKSSLALALLALGIAGFYVLSGQPLVFRVLAVLGGLIGAIAVGWFTVPGQRFFVFSKESWTETKKVAWPSRKETVQTTGIVFAFVVAMAIVLWLTDKGLEWLLYDLILGWKH